MMPVKQYPDSILLHPCIPVDFPADIEGTLDILHYMKIVVDSHKAAGLAANQVGDTRRIIVYQSNSGMVLGLVNPVITAHSEEKDAKLEGCLSLPQIQVSVPRYREITITAIGEDDDPEVKLVPFSQTFTGEEARRIQHEIDHLNGVLIVDYLKKLDRSMLMNKWMKRMKQIGRKNRKWKD
jgi:peptide deformylase